VRRPLRDPERTRATILLHATREFATRGFGGARVDSIAARCKLSKNTLYYYFGSKERLFVVVLEGVYERLLERQAAMQLPALQPVEAVRQMVAQTFGAFRDMPEAIRLLNEENLHRARHVRHSDRMRPLYDRLIGAIADVLTRGHAAGIWRSGIDPVNFYLSISSMAYHYLSNGHTLQIALARDLSSAAAQQAWMEHITAMMLAFCRAPEAAATRRRRSGMAPA
jgi:TetR/AcrR family transcriptional regulator